VQLRVQVLRFSFLATRAFKFPLPASNKLRGAIGNGLRLSSDEGYRRFFAPKQLAGPSGLMDAPRPFVLRSAHLDGIEIAEGGSFGFDLCLFDLESGWEAILGEALATVNFARLVQVESEDVLTLGLNPNGRETARTVRVEFLTPTELKAEGGMAKQPRFSVLATRIRDRISTLRQLYGAGALDIDFAGFGERATLVQTARCQIRHVEAQRRSGRTGQIHSLGGFVGEADYTGDLTEFLPYLRAAQWTGVGRQTTWGKGAIALQESIL